VPQRDFYSAGRKAIVVPNERDVFAAAVLECEFPIRRHAQTRASIDVFEPRVSQRSNVVACFIIAKVITDNDFD
jgi:hypothetical protein